MEYGEAINDAALERAVDIARRRRTEVGRTLSEIAAEAVSRAFCVCVVDGEDAAEGRLSNVHKSLIEAVELRTGGRPARWSDRRAQIGAHTTHSRADHV